MLSMAGKANFEVLQDLYTQFYKLDLADVLSSSSLSKRTPCLLCYSLSLSCLSFSLFLSIAITLKP